MFIIISKHSLEYILKEVLGAEDFSCFRALFVVVREVFVKVRLDLVSRGFY